MLLMLRMLPMDDDLRDEDEGEAERDVGGVLVGEGLAERQWKGP